MPINYRNVDPSKVAGDVMKDRSLEWEERAYAAEMEVKRLETIQSLDPGDGQVAEALMEKRREAKDARGKAKRAAGAAPLDAEEVIEVRTEFLNRWLTDVETKHAAQTAMLTDIKRQLGLKGRDALSIAEKKEAREGAVETDKAIKMLEATHELITGAIDALNDHPDSSGKGKRNGKASAEALAGLEV